MVLHDIRKSRKGAAMIWAIMFGLVIAALITLLITMMMFSGFSARNTREQQKRKTQLNQIGEYFMRCLEADGNFPTGYVGKNTLSNGRVP